MSSKVSKLSNGPPIPAKVRPTYDAIVALTDAFCRGHLNDEYAELCRRLAGVLSRKRPTPITRGRVESWACGIVRTIAIRYGGGEAEGDPTKAQAGSYASRLDPPQQTRRQSAGVDGGN